MKLVITKKTKLCDLEVGKLFMTPDMECLAVKSEYRTEKGAIEAIIVGSGEMFWGGTSDPKEQRVLEVLEVDIIEEISDDKIKAVQDWRDAQAQQLKEDTKDMSSLERVQGALQLHHIDGILKGLDIALNILRKDEPKDNRTIEDCIHYDCYQGRHKCTNSDVKSSKCQGVCDKFTPKKS